MPRQGRFLEILVRELQIFLVPEGFIVKSPEEFYDKGVKIGEIDVTVRGDFGFSRVFLGIECRDRPGKRNQRQGRPWIRELATKKREFGVTEMVAVSTTGFTPPAVQLAESERISLITVENITNFKSSGWFQVVYFTWNNPVRKIDGPISLETLPPLVAPGRLTINDPIFRLHGSSETIALKEYIDPEINVLLPSFERNAEDEIHLTIKTSRPASILVNGTEHKIVEITVPVKLQKRPPVKALLHAYKRPDGSEDIAFSGTCEIETNGKKELVVILVKKKWENGVVADGEMVIRFLDENFRPINRRREIEVDFLSSDGTILSSKRGSNYGGK